jgi:hypothetical protein
LKEKETSCLWAGGLGAPSLGLQVKFYLEKKNQVFLIIAVIKPNLSFLGEDTEIQSGVVYTCLCMFGWVVHSTGGSVQRELKFHPHTTLSPEPWHRITPTRWKKHFFFLI